MTTTPIYGKPLEKYLDKGDPMVRARDYGEVRSGKRLDIDVAQDRKLSPVAEETDLFLANLKQLTESIAVLEKSLNWVLETEATCNESECAKEPSPPPRSPLTALLRDYNVQLGYLNGRIVSIRNRLHV